MASCVMCITLTVENLAQSLLFWEVVIKIQNPTVADVVFEVNLLSL